MIDICTVNTSDGIIMVPYRVVHSRRSRRLHLSLDEAKHAVLTLPRRGTKREAIEFLKRNGDWFSKNATYVTGRFYLLMGNGFRWISYSRLENLRCTAIKSRRA